MYNSWDLIGQVNEIQRYIRSTHPLFAKYKNHSKHVYIFMTLLRLLLHKTRSVWDQYEIGMDKPCAYTEPCRSPLDQFSYSIPNGFTCKIDPVWNCTVPGCY